VSGLHIPLVQDSPRRSRYERNQHLLRSAHSAVDDSAAPLDSQTETPVRRVSFTKDVPILWIDYVWIKGKLLGVRQALYSGGVLDFKEMNRRFVHVFPEGTEMKNIKFVVKVNRGGTRAPEYVQRVDPTPIHMTTNRRLALLMGRFTAEDAIKSLQHSRCIPELESVQVSA
jgi:hypothetical protein